MSDSRSEHSSEETAKKISKEKQESMNAYSRDKYHYDDAYREQRLFTAKNYREDNRDIINKKAKSLIFIKDGQEVTKEDLAYLCDQDGKLIEAKVLKNIATGDRFYLNDD